MGVARGIHWGICGLLGLRGTGGGVDHTYGYMYMCRLVRIMFPGFPIPTLMIKAWGGLGIYEARLVRWLYNNTLCRT